MPVLGGFDCIGRELTEVEYLATCVIDVQNTTHVAFSLTTACARKSSRDHRDVMIGSDTVSSLSVTTFENLGNTTFNSCCETINLLLIMLVVITGMLGTW